MLLPLLLLPGCNPYELNRIRITDSFSQAPSNKVDVLWVIDNSVSMSDEQAAVSAAAADFLAQMEGAGMDFQLGVITTDIDDDNPDGGKLLGTPAILTSNCLDDGDGSDCDYAYAFSERVRQGVSGDDQEKGLQAVVAAIVPPLVDTFNAGFVRDDSLLMIIVLSDENDCSDFGALGPVADGGDCYEHREALVPVADLVQRIADAKPADAGGVVLHGIIGPDVGCLDAFPGTRYAQAISMLGGSQADICLEDYAPVMAELGLAATGIRESFQLSNAADPESIEVTVSPADAEAYTVAADDLAGWTYLSDYAQVRFNGEAVPPRGAQIDVSYYKTGPVPTVEETTGSTAGPGETGS